MDHMDAISGEAIVGIVACLAAIVLGIFVLFAVANWPSHPTVHGICVPGEIDTPNFSCRNL